MSPSKIILSNDHLVAIDFLSTYGGQYFASRLSPPLNGVVQIQDLNLNRYSYCYRNLGKAIRIRGGFAVIPTNYQQSIAKAFKRITPRRFKQPPRPLVKRIFFSKSKSDILNSIGVGTVTNAVHNLNLASSDDNKDPLTSKHFLLHPIRRNLHFLCVARTRKTVTGKVIFGAITIGSTFYDCTRCILPIKLKQDIAISAAFTALESLSNAKEYTNDAVKDEIYKKFVKSNFKKWLDKPVFPQNWLDRPLLP